MPSTSLGITYPTSTGHPRLWEHLQTMATGVNDILTKRTPLYGTGKLSAQYNVSTTLTDLSGCSLTFNLPTATAVAHISFALDCVLGTASTAVVVLGQVNIDGVDISSPQAIWGAGNMSVGTSTRAVVANSLTTVLSGTGNHTIKLRAAQSTGATGIIRLQALHTQVSALVLPY